MVLTQSLMKKVKDTELEVEQNFRQTLKLVDVITGEISTEIEKEHDDQVAALENLVIKFKEYNNQSKLIKFQRVKDLRSKINSDQLQLQVAKMNGL